MEYISQIFITRVLWNTFLGYLQVLNITAQHSKSPVRSTTSQCLFIYIYIYLFNRAYNILVPAGAHGRQRRHRTTCKRNQLNAVVQYKTVCSWSLLLLHNTVGGVLWAGEMRAEQDGLHHSGIVRQCLGGTVDV